MAVSVPGLVISDPTNQSGVLRSELCAGFTASAYEFGPNLLTESEFEAGAGTGVGSAEGPDWTTDYDPADDILLAVDTWAFFDTDAGQVTDGDLVAAGIPALDDKSLAFNIGTSLADKILSWANVAFVANTRYVLVADIAAIDLSGTDPVIALYIDGDLVVEIPAVANDGDWHSVKAEFDWSGATDDLVVSINGTNPGAGNVIAIDRIGLFAATPIVPVDAGGYTITETGRDETGIQYEICGTPYAAGTVAHAISVTNEAEDTASQSVNFTGVAATASCVAATDIEQTTATLNGTIGSIQAVGSVRFAFGSATGVYDAHIQASPYANGAVTGSAANLQPGTTYYYRVQVLNYVGNIVATSAECSFTTDAADVVTSEPCTDCLDEKVSLAPAQRVVVVDDIQPAVDVDASLVRQAGAGTVTVPAGRRYVRVQVLAGAPTVSIGGGGAVTLAAGVDLTWQVNSGNESLVDEFVFTGVSGSDFIVNATVAA